MTHKNEEGTKMTNRKIKSAAERSAEFGVHLLSPHLICKNAREAIDFYKSAFGATEMMVMPGADGKIMHACVTINGSSVMIADEHPNCGSSSPTTLGGTPVSLHLIVDDADATVEHAVAAGAKVVMPVADMFWGDRYGLIEDPSGHRWAIATPPERPLTETEILEAAKSAM
jgi:PhnB protein